MTNDRKDFDFPTSPDNKEKNRPITELESALGIDMGGKNIDQDMIFAGETANTGQAANKKKSPMEVMLDEAAAAISRTYRKYMTLVRMAFQDDPSTFLYLELHKPAYWGDFLEVSSAKGLYERILSKNEILMKLKEYGITKKDLEVNLKKAKKLLDNRFWQKKRNRSYRQMANINQVTTRKMEEIDKKYEFMAREACKDFPEYLEQLGIEPKTDDNDK
ncbi:MAG: hypothetical protein GTO45_03320 [Candidatus Aminicenantes bacterium]|nr:hypothetical protein [Candidatus Aminicenantes bacterium]NIM77757.1 hypothetical protein [Candidatus Aminicenantes bacterium]NIN17070.1 hypothetical protein [Candidatus Aminicenantes bacterium]NIN40963.1 hypothetical protein [Candidatus Aminicenantes bacterium]NIN83768.1 hypothetical protein [Candidatus Aminicenantes bacterium]